MKYTIEYHSDIEDDMDWFDIESKNYLRDVVLTIENKNYNLYFSGIERVMYDIINSGQGYFFKKNLILLPSFSKKAMEETIEKIVENSVYKSFSEDY